MIVLNKKLLLSTLLAFGSLLYSINGFSQFNYDIGVTSITSSSPSCVASLDTLWVDIENFGNLPIDSFNVIWNINGAIDSSWFITPILTAPNNSVHLQLATFSLDTGVNQITVATSLSNNNQDQNTVNDIMSYTAKEDLPQVTFFDYCNDRFISTFIIQDTNTSYVYWDFGDGTCDSTTTDTVVHFYPWTTQDHLNFTVTASLFNQCGSKLDTSFVNTVYYYVGSPCYLSTKENNNPIEIKFFPNPSYELLNIEFTPASNNLRHIALFNPKGELVYQKESMPNSDSEQINVANLPEGLYLLRITSGNHIETKQITVN